MLNFILLYASDAEKAVWILIALSLDVLVGYWGSKRRIGFGWAFFLSFINILIGIIAVLCSPKIDKVNFTEVKKEDSENSENI